MENKKRLIDADALRNKIAEENPYIHIDPFGYCACSPKTDGVLVFKREDVLRAIDSAPTIDAVVLPCKDDDIVFVNLFGQVLPFVVISTNLFMGTPIFKAQHGINLVWIFRLDDFGKTVFLTREEAEAALDRMKG